MATTKSPRGSAKRGAWEEPGTQGHELLLADVDQSSLDAWASAPL